MAQQPFPIIDVSTWQKVREEPVGKKVKFWVEDDRGQNWLFKERKRPNVGDDWSEKIASEVARLLGIPHAHYELAVCRKTWRIGTARFELARPVVQAAPDCSA